VIRVCTVASRVSELRASQRRSSPIAATGQRYVDVIALGQIPNGDLLAGVSGLEPADDVAVDDVEVVLDDDHVARLGGQADDFTLAHAVAGDVDALAVDVDEAMADELTGLRTCAGPAGAVHDVVEALLEQPQQVLTGRALQAHGLFVGVAELTLEDAVDVLRLLLLLQLGEVLAAVVAATRPAVANVHGELTPRISRYAAITAAVKQLGDEAVVHANGYPSRESHAVADRAQNFYMIGSMGLASAIGLGVALNRPGKTTVVFDGDGNLLMNLGILPMIGALAPRRFVHCVFDNEVYGSTGNQRSPAAGVRLDALAAAAGYRTVAAAVSPDEIARHLANALATDGPHFLLVKVTAEEADVPRIALTPAQIRDRFRASLGPALP